MPCNNHLRLYKRVSSNKSSTDYDFNFNNT